MFRVNNMTDVLLKLSVSECHGTDTLYSMGRPLWKAYMTSPQGGMPAHRVLVYAKQKLMFKKVLTEVEKPDNFNRTLVTHGLSTRPWPRWEPEFAWRFLRSLVMRLAWLQVTWGLRFPFRTTESQWVSHPNQYWLWPLEAFGGVPATV